MNARYNHYGERLRFDNFRIFRTGEEEWLFNNLGSEVFAFILSQAFEYSYWESKYLEKMSGMKLRGNEGFKELCDYRRIVYMRNIADMLQLHLEVFPNRPFVVRDYSPEEIQKKLERRYHSIKHED